MMEIGALGVRSDLQSPPGLFLYVSEGSREGFFIDIGGRVMILYTRLVYDNQRDNLDQEETDRKSLFF